MKLLLSALLLTVILSSEATSDELYNIVSMVQTGASPVQLIVAHLDSLVFSVRQEQEGHYDIFQAQNKECDQELTFRRSEVAHYTEQKARSTERLNKCKSQLLYAQSDIDTLLRYQTLFTEDVEYARVQRVDQSAAFRRKVDNFNYALQTIDMAVPIVDNWINGQGSFAQVAQHFNQIFIQASRVGFTSEITPMFAVLAQTQQPGAVSIDLGDRLKTLLQTIRDKILASMKNLTDIENSQIVSFQNRKNRSENVLDMIESLVTFIRNELEVTKKCIVREGDIINACVSNISRNANVLTNANLVCAAYEQNFNGNTISRAQQIDFIAKLRKFILAKGEEFGTFEGGEVENVFGFRSQSKSFLQLSTNLRMKQ